jgi:hypothetical protein
MFLSALLLFDSICICIFHRSSCCDLVPVLLRLKIEGMKDPLDLQTDNSKRADDIFRAASKALNQAARDSRREKLLKAAREGLAEAAEEADRLKKS